jgi:hypothetical protein
MQLVFINFQVVFLGEKVYYCSSAFFPQGKFKVCRYLFVRCDNEPAPWTRFDKILDFCLVSIRLYSICRKQAVVPTDIYDLLLSDDHGDLPRPLPKIKELQGATDITERNGRPAWDYDVCLPVSYCNNTELCEQLNITELCYDFFYSLQ